MRTTEEGEPDDTGTAAEAGGKILLPMHVLNAIEHQVLAGWRNQGGGGGTQGLECASYAHAVDPRNK